MGVSGIVGENAGAAGCEQDRDGENDEQEEDLEAEGCRLQAVEQGAVAGVGLVEGAGFGFKALHGAAAGGVSQQGGGNDAGVGGISRSDEAEPFGFCRAVVLDQGIGLTVAFEVAEAFALLGDFAHVLKGNGEGDAAAGAVSAGNGAGGSR